MLACIRCGACLNACPVYRQAGGHAYGWVYPGPMGAVLTPLLDAHRAGAAEVADASTLCGACMEACPVEIPLQDLLLSLRRRKAAGVVTHHPPGLAHLGPGVGSAGPPTRAALASASRSPARWSAPPGGSPR